MTNKTELLQKIKALADRGDNGERESAQAALARLMDKYGITEEDLETERRETTWFAYSQETERRLLVQIIYMATGDHSFGCVGTHTGRKKKKVGADCTAAERIEIESTYEFFKAAMNEELEIFYVAFVNKNHLFPPESKCKSRDDERFTAEQRELALKASWMMKSMERRTMRKALTEAQGKAVAT